jgi:hypothetical protein
MPRRRACARLSGGINSRAQRPLIPGRESTMSTRSPIVTSSSRSTVYRYLITIDSPPLFLPRTISYGLCVGLPMFFACKNRKRFLVPMKCCQFPFLKFPFTSSRDCSPPLPLHPPRNAEWGPWGVTELRLSIFHGSSGYCPRRPPPSSEPGLDSSLDCPFRSGSTRGCCRFRAL